MQPEIREIRLNTSDPAGATVRAGVYGFVAVHVPLNDPDPNTAARAITHVATGNQIRSGLYRDVAIRIAEQIGTDPEWGFGTVAEFKQRRESLKAKLDAALNAATEPKKGGAG